jgi:glutamate--cysteine ligase regulatory subunit
MDQTDRTISNIMTGTTVIRRPTFEKSNTELTTSLRSNFAAHQPSDASKQNTKPSFRTWTTQEDQTLYIPTHTPSPLSEPRSSYDITVKLFYLPNIPSSRRCAHTRRAIDLVLRELGTTSIDLLIVSFPGISFDADDSDVSDSEDNEPDTPPADPTSSLASDGCDDDDVTPEEIPTMIETWRTLETLHDDGVVKKLGIAEFGCQRLGRFLPLTRVRPSVDQINVRDCCVVPKPLILFAKKEGIELLTHNDCTNVLPRGTLRELLSKRDNGGGVLATGDDSGEGLRGDVEPQFVVKYTAVVKDRGVVESKGYFAVAELREDS